jgi:RNA polymerase sigma-70 factor (ECF subfamily)
MKSKFTYSEEEIRELIHCNYSRIIAYIRKLLGKQAQVCDAEDLFQDALYQFIEKRADITTDKAAGYLFRIVRNRTLNHLTRNKLDKLAVHTDDYAASAWDTLAMLDYEGTIETNEKPVDSVGIEDIIGYSDTFSPRMREIFYLSRIEGLTHREIAERLQISTRMVERYLQQSVIEYRSFFGFNSHDSKNS